PWPLVCHVDRHNPRAADSKQRLTFVETFFGVASRHLGIDHARHRHRIDVHDARIGHWLADLICERELEQHRTGLGVFRRCREGERESVHLTGLSSCHLFLAPHFHARHAFHTLHAWHALHPFHAGHVHPFLPFHPFHLPLVRTTHLPIAHTAPPLHPPHAPR